MDMFDVKEKIKAMKNVVMQVTPIEAKVRACTSNDPWGAKSTDKSEVAEATYNFEDYKVIMQTIWKRMADTGKDWRHVYKGLQLLEYLIVHGSERVHEEAKDSLYTLRSLRSFRYVDEKGKDYGESIRELAKKMVKFVQDEKGVQEEREKAKGLSGKYEGFSRAESRYKAPSKGSSSLRNPSSSSSRRKEYDSDEEERPRSGRRGGDDDEEEEPAPRKKEQTSSRRKDYDEDEDDEQPPTRNAPVKKPSNTFDEEEEFDEPRRPSTTTTRNGSTSSNTRQPRPPSFDGNDPTSSVKPPVQKQQQQQPPVKQVKPAVDVNDFFTPSADSFFDQAPVQSSGGFNNNNRQQQPQQQPQQQSGGSGGFNPRGGGSRVQQQQQVEDFDPNFDNQGDFDEGFPQDEFDTFKSGKEQKSENSLFTLTEGLVNFSLDENTKKEPPKTTPGGVLVPSGSSSGANTQNLTLSQKAKMQGKKINSNNAGRGQPNVLQPTSQPPIGRGQPPTFGMSPNFNQPPTFNGQPGFNQGYNNQPGFGGYGGGFGQPMMGGRGQNPGFNPTSGYNNQPGGLQPNSQPPIGRGQPGGRGQQTRPNLVSGSDNPFF